MAQRTRIIAGRLFALLFVCALLLSSESFALGVTPARTTIREGDVPYFVFTPRFSEGEEGVVTISVEGDLADKIHFDKTLLANGEVARGLVDVPSDLEPGDHPQRIVLRLITQSSAGGFGANVEVAGLLVVNKPYPESYLRGDFFLNTDPGTNAITTTVMLENMGVVPVTPESVIIGLIDGSDEKGLITMVPEKVLPSSFSKLTAEYFGVKNGELSPGVYAAVLDVPYGERTFHVEKEFAVGEPTLSVESVVYNDESGAIKPIDVAGMVRWNRPLDVTFTVYLDNKTDPSIVERKTLSGAYLERLYLDTARIGVPVSDVEVVISYGSSSASGTTRTSFASPVYASIWRWVMWMVLALLLLFLIIIFWRRRKRPAMLDTSILRDAHHDSAPAESSTSSSVPSVVSGVPPVSDVSSVQVPSTGSSSVDK